MLIHCKLGPTTQNVGGTAYVFAHDRKGRAVCDIGDDHAHLFLARADIYVRADGLAAPVPPEGIEDVMADDLLEADDEDFEDDEEGEEDDLGGFGTAEPIDGTIDDLAAAATKMPDLELPAEIAEQQAAYEAAAAPETRDPLDHDGDGKPGGAAPLLGNGFEAMTVPQLEAFAKATQVRLGQARKKADIIALLEAAGKTPPAKE